MRSYEKSKAAVEEAQRVMPGGVNSPVRAFKSVNMDPIFMERGKGSKIYDIDGNEYIDYVLSWGPLILGHSNEKVVKEIQKAAEHGTSFGAPTELETELAELVIDRVPSIEIVRMVSSGTEATMSALRTLVLCQRILSHPLPFGVRPRKMARNRMMASHSDMRIWKTTVSI